MADPKEILSQYEDRPPDEDGFLFSTRNGQLRFNPWESVKSFMGSGHAPGYLSTSGDTTPITSAADTAGWLGLSGLGLNWAGAAPANAAGVFGGRLGAKTLAEQGIPAPQKALELAERMKAAGASRDEIWRETAALMEREDPRFSGVHYGKEGAPQFEIPDYQAKWPPRMTDEWDMRNTMISRAGETLEHPLLYAAYPEMRDVPMSAKATPRSPNEGAFDPGTFPGDIRDARFSVSGPTPKKARSAALHELDHGTAFIEGHARGSSPERAAYIIDPADYEMRNILAERDYLAKQFEASVPGEDPHYRSRKADLEYANQALDARAKEIGYKRSAGETRARNAQKRADMTPEQLRRTPPWETQDVPDAQQILEMYGTGPQRSVDMSLPMDDASRLARAREMGFDTDRVFHHGTFAEFDEFDPLKATHTAKQGGNRFPQIHLTTSKEEAGTYGPSVLSLYARGNYGRIQNPMTMQDEVLRRLEMTLRKIEADEMEGSLAEMKGRDYTYKYNPETADRIRRYLEGASITQNYTDKIAHARLRGELAKARRAGLDGVEIAGGWGDDVAGDHLVVFNPANIRSTQAAFDPTKKDRANLLAASGVPVTTADILRQYGDDND